MYVLGGTPEISKIEIIAYSRSQECTVSKLVHNIHMYSSSFQDGVHLGLIATPSRLDQLFRSNLQRKEGENAKLELSDKFVHLTLPFTIHKLEC